MENSAVNLQIQGYEQQLAILKSSLLQNDPANQYSMNCCFETVGQYDETQFRKNISSLKLKDGFVQDRADFTAAEMVRALYTGFDVATAEIKNIPICGTTDGKISIQSARTQIEDAFDKFQFWPTDTQNKLANVTFWSENHMLLYLSSGYLYLQYKFLFKCNAPTDNKDAFVSGVIQEVNADTIAVVLRKYLTGHCKPEFNGLYEINSPKYVHYTMAALLNLYDLALDIEIRTFAEKMLDRIAYFLMLATDAKKGIFAFGGKYSINVFMIYHM